MAMNYCACRIKGPVYADPPPSGIVICQRCGLPREPHPMFFDMREEASPEIVNHPPHYGGPDDPYEVIKVIEAWKLGFNLGNTVKYIGRAGKKDDLVTDLEKARWYLDREIARLKRGQ